MFGIIKSCDICEHNSKNNPYIDQSRLYCTLKAAKLKESIKHSDVSLNCDGCLDFQPEESEIPSLVYLHDHLDLFEMWLSVYNAEYNNNDGFSSTAFDTSSNRIENAVLNCFSDIDSEMLDDNDEFDVNLATPCINRYLTEICSEFPAVAYILHYSSFSRSSENELFAFDVKPIVKMANYTK